MPRPGASSPCPAGRLLWLGLAALVACEGAPARGDGAEAPDGAYSFGPARPAGEALPPLCARDRRDAVRDVFCGSEAPHVESLIDLEAHLGLALAPEGRWEGSALEPSGGYGGSERPRPVFVAHSTALSGELVSPINPRAILFRDGTFLAFNRGVQQVELAARDRGDRSFNFYLVTFEQPCNEAPGGCLPGDLYTARVESGWTRVRVEDDEDLKNTPFDCRQCHRRGTDRSILLMRELNGPWTHFFLPDVGASTDLPEPSGADLVRDFVLARGDEPYAGVPTSAIRASGGNTLQGVIESRQPLVFDGLAILNERWPWSPGGYGAGPARSPTWDAAYAAFQRGEQLPLPHPDPRPTDPAKQAALTEAYRAFREGTLAAEELPDLADVFPDDPEVRAEIGLSTAPGASPAEVLVQACGPCHNGVLDQSITRARFSIDLARMDRAELDVAIARITAPPGSAGVMPPPGRRQLHGTSRGELVEYLRRGERPAEDDALLARAARLGMAVEPGTAGAEP